MCKLTLAKSLDPLITFAGKVNADANHITQTDIDTAKPAGWSDQTIEDVIGIVAINKLYTILATGTGFGTLPANAAAQTGVATVQSDGHTPMFKGYIHATPEPD